MERLNSVIAAAIFVSMSVFSLQAVAFDEMGEKAYKRCAPCHLPTGKGVPSAFPPINDRLTGMMGTEEGRHYLVMVVSKGLMGPIDVDGTIFRGVMPALGAGLKPEEVAAVLNYIAEDLSNTPQDYQSFTVEEVVAIQEANPKENGRTVHLMRQTAIESVQ